MPFLGKRTKSYKKPWKNGQKAAIPQNTASGMSLQGNTNVKSSKEKLKEVEKQQADFE